MLQDTDSDGRSATDPIPPPATRETRISTTGAPLRIGRYLLVRRIASGGMGTVHEAIDETLRRRVAFKMMRHGIGSPPARKRFELEGQLLARLRHPGIAQVYDAGIYGERDDRPEGEDEVPIPYFVMELVTDAQPITTFAGSAHLDLRAKLELFAGVCDAVYHGHEHGVIHRDLKPTNILVDSSGHPKIIDFGVAYATDADLLVIDAGVEMVGTLQYMSPEQAFSGPRDIDVRSDVYALGLVLYELLTGRLPYEVPDGSVEEARRTILEQAPGRLGTTDRALRGDLETIVHKAIEKDRQRRFATVEVFGAEIRRWLRGEPIETRRASLAYVARVRVRGAVSRHPVASLALTVLASAAVARAVGFPLLFQWTPANRLFEQVLTMALVPVGTGEFVDTVRVVTFGDGTDVAALAGREDLRDVGWDDIKSLRRLHGRFMEHLAHGRPRVVVWDVTFNGETSFDADFVRGVEALREAGAEVVVAVPSWARDEEGLPPVSRALLPHVRWGGVTGRFDEAHPWRLELVVQKPGADPMPSLALAAVASFEHPEAEVSMALDPVSGRLGVRYRQRSPLSPHVRPSFGGPLDIELSSVVVDDGRSEASGIQRGDLVGRFLLAVPGAETLSAARVEYARVFEAGAEQLRRWFAGRAVVIGNNRGGRDRWTHPDGRRIEGAFGHAAGIDAILRSESVRLPRPWHVLTMLFLGAALGAVIAALLAAVAAGGGRRAIVVTAIAVAALLASAMAYRQMLYLCNPLVPILAMVVAAELSARVLRLRGVQTA